MKLLISEILNKKEFLKFLRKVYPSKGFMELHRKMDMLPIAIVDSEYILDQYILDLHGIATCNLFFETNFENLTKEIISETNSELNEAIKWKQSLPEKEQKYIDILIKNSMPRSL